MSIETGFPSQSQEYIAKTLDFNKILVPNPPATFVFIADTSELLYRCIHYDAMLIVDRSLTPKSGDLVVYYAQGEVRCREYAEIGYKKCFVNAEGKEIPRCGQTVIFGVVTKVIQDP